MNTASIVWTSFIIVIVYISLVNGLKCFQCTAVEDPVCADLKQNDTASPYYKECPEEIYGRKPILCRKTVHQILFRKDEAPRITRGCGFEIYKNNVSNCYRSDTDYRTEFSCQCFTDACNASSHLRVGFAIVLPLLIINKLLAIALF